jgi:hypothetical protein
MLWRATIPLALIPSNSIRGSAVGQSRSDRLRRAADCCPSHSTNHKKHNILARLKAEELLRRAENEEFRKQQNSFTTTNPEDLANPDQPQRQSTALACLTPTTRQRGALEFKSARAILHQPSHFLSTAPACVRSRAVTLFASKKSEPRQPSAPCKQVLKCKL